MVLWSGGYFTHIKRKANPEVIQTNDPMISGDIPTYSHLWVWYVIFMHQPGRSPKIWGVKYIPHLQNLVQQIGDLPHTSQKLRQEKYQP